MKLEQIRDVAINEGLLLSRSNGKKALNFYICQFLNFKLTFRKNNLYLGLVTANLFI